MESSNTPVVITDNTLNSTSVPKRRRVSKNSRRSGTNGADKVQDSLNDFERHLASTSNSRLEKMSSSRKGIIEASASKSRLISESKNPSTKIKTNPERKTKSRTCVNAGSKNEQEPSADFGESSMKTANKRSLTNPLKMTLSSKPNEKSRSTRAVTGKSTKMTLRSRGKPRGRDVRKRTTSARSRLGVEVAEASESHKEDLSPGSEVETDGRKTGVRKAGKVGTTRPPPSASSYYRSESEDSLTTDGPTRPDSVLSTKSKQRRKSKIPPVDVVPGYVSSYEKNVQEFFSISGLSDIGANQSYMDAQLLDKVTSAVLKRTNEINEYRRLSGDRDALQTSAALGKFKKITGNYHRHRESLNIFGETFIDTFEDIEQYDLTQDPDALFEELERARKSQISEKARATLAKTAEVEVKSVKQKPSVKLVTPPRPAARRPSPRAAPTAPTVRVAPTPRATPASPRAAARPRAASGVRAPATAATTIVGFPTRRSRRSRRSTASSKKST